MTGKSLNDKKWHLVIVKKVKNHMVLELDQRLVGKISTKPKNYKLEMRGGDELVFFGGAKSSEELVITKSKTNFVGCLQQLSFNGHNVVDRLLYSEDWRFTHYGPLNQSCSVNG